MDYIKGRGAQVNPDNKFLKNSVEADPEFLDHMYRFDEESPSLNTEFIKIFPKSIVNKVDSPDLGMNYSMNPYQGCEHGCIYCYARNTHEYWGYSAGKDFESKILIKHNAAKLLERKLDSKNWEPTPIMLSGNTDCYQPIERKLRITRSMLQVLADCRHPVGLITKNALVLRDIDLLADLAKDHLATVAISITTLDNQLKNLLEPRTSAVEQRFKAVERLTEAGIPVAVMMAPVIPAINSQEIMDLAKRAADAGATALRYTIVRLNGVLPEIFSDWLERHFPDRKDKVLNQIKELHGGKLNDSRFGKRIKGEGEYSSNIAQLFSLAKKKYNLDRSTPAFNPALFRRPSDRQLKLF